MEVLHGFEALDPPLSQSVLTVGNFDGVHRAHQQLLAQAGLFAANTDGPVVVLTFEPHPLTIVSPAKAPKLLSQPNAKLKHLSQAGADVTVVAESEPAILGLTAEQFVEEIIVKRFHPTHVVEGPTFGFGRGRKGTPELLRHLASKFNYEVHIVEPVTVQIDQGETLLVSSSLIRRLLVEGKVRRAGLCLGRPYALHGQVVAGDRRGRTIGFPTANIVSTGQLVPGEGVYAGRALTECGQYSAAISIGKAATFGGVESRIEAHLLDFDGDLYRQDVVIEFGRRLREQETFESADALIEQVGRDVQEVRATMELSHQNAPEHQGHAQ